MSTRIALVTDVEDVAALAAAGRPRDVRVIALTLRARLAARRAGIAYDDLGDAASQFDRLAMLADARRIARSWYQQPFVGESNTLRPVVNWRGYPLVAMQTRHMVDWFAEALSALEVARIIVEMTRPAEVWLRNHLRAPGYWCTPADNWDAAALALIAEAYGIPVVQSQRPETKRPTFARVRDWVRSSWMAAAPHGATIADSCLVHDQFGLEEALASAGRRVLVLTRGQHYWSQLEPYVLQLANSAEVIVATHASFNDATCAKLDDAGVASIELRSLLDVCAVPLARMGDAAIAELDASPAVHAFFSDTTGTRFWPLIRRKFATLFGRDIPETARNIAAAERLLDDTRPALLLTGLCVAGVDRAYALAARRRGIPSVGVQHGTVLAGNASLLDFATDVFAVWGHPTRHTLQAARGRSTRELPVVGRVTSNLCRQRSDIRASLGLDSERPVCLYLGAIGWAVNDVHRYAEETVLGTVLDLPRDVPGLQLMLRLHAGEDVASMRALAAERGIRAIIEPDASLEELLQLSDVVISQSTTAGLEALVADKPLVYLNICCERDWLPYATSGAALGVYSPSELAPAVIRVLNEPVLRESLRLAGRRLVREELNGHHEGAAARMVRLCLAMMNARDRRKCAETHESALCAAS